MIQFVQQNLSPNIVQVAFDRELGVTKFSLS